jgi:myo-inositol-1(or 4)-monophosphatase
MSEALMNKNQIDSLLKFTEEIATSAGKLIYQRKGNSLRVSTKGSNDIVTDADIASQELITAAILAEYPDHGFLAEEADKDLPGPKDITWIIDPIDGTINYNSRKPFYCVSIGILMDGEPMLGVIYDPIHSELFSSVIGKGCSLNGKPIHCAKNNALLEDATIGFDWDILPEFRMKTSEVLAQMINKTRTVNVFGSASLALAWVASGRMDGYFKFNIDVWDAIPGLLMIREAGGKVTTHKNTYWVWKSEDKTFLASNGTLHTSLLNFFQS